MGVFRQKLPGFFGSSGTSEKFFDEEAYLADDVICFVSFLDQKMLDKVTVKVSL